MSATAAMKLTERNENQSAQERRHASEKNGVPLAG
jgi:hypothetical protein